MSTQRENDQLNTLSTQVAVMDEKLSTLTQSFKDQRADIKTMNTAIQGFTFVKEQDYQKGQTIVNAQLSKLHNRVERLEQNTSLMVKFQNAVGERGTQLLVLIFFALIIFGFYLLLRHIPAASVLSGNSGETAGAH